MRPTRTVGWSNERFVVACRLTVASRCVGISGNRGYVQGVQLGTARQIHLSEEIENRGCEKREQPALDTRQFEGNGRAWVTYSLHNKVAVRVHTYCRISSLHATWSNPPFLPISSFGWREHKLGGLRRAERACYWLRTVGIARELLCGE